MSEHNRNNHEFDRPQDNPALARAVIYFALSAQEEGFTTRELFLELKGQELLPKTDYFAKYFTESIKGQVIEHIEEQGGLAQWSNLGKQASRRYFLEYVAPTQNEVSGDEFRISEEREVSREELLEEKHLSAIYSILDTMSEFEHDAQYLVQKTLLKDLKDVGLVDDSEDFKRILEYLVNLDAVILGSRENRKRGAFTFVKWKSRDVQRAWLLKRKENIDAISSGKSLILPPKSKKERKEVRKRRRN